MGAGVKRVPVSNGCQTGAGIKRVPVSNGFSRFSRAPQTLTENAQLDKQDSTTKCSRTAQLNAETKQWA